MALSSDLISKFVKATRDDPPKKNESTTYGTVRISDNRYYVIFDGSDILTPVESTVVLKNNDRVIVTVKDHKATVTGNISSPSAANSDVEVISGTVSGISEDIDAIEQSVGEFAVIVSDYASFNTLVTGQLTTITADIQTLFSDYAEIDTLVTDSITAINADIQTLNADKLSVTDAEIEYANINFTNIDIAAIETLFATSGIIEDIVVNSGVITGELVGVTIKGDLIKGGTIVADKLVVKGNDGLYYRLNTDGETIESQQTDYNSLDGSVITTKSITATKINVSDLVAFDATIGGFNISNTSIYSGVKNSVNNTTSGIYLDKNGQMSIGDGTNYVKYYKDSNDQYRLEVSASSVLLGSGNRNVETAINETVKNIVVEYALSVSTSIAPSSGWSTTAPEWENGKYMWQRTTKTLSNGTSSSTITCISGAKGQDGEDGVDGTSVTISSTSVTYKASNSQTNIPSGTWSTTIPQLDASTPYLWTRTIVNYSPSGSTTSYSVSGTLEGVEPIIDSAIESNISSVYESISEQNTNIISNFETIILEALETYIETGEYEEFKSEIKTQLSILSDEINIKFSSTTSDIINVEESFDSKFTELYKYITFSENGIEIGNGINGITLSIDNDEGIIFSKNGTVFGSWDGDNFYTGDIVVRVNERAQFGNFAFVPRTDGSLSFLKVSS